MAERNKPPPKKKPRARAKAATKPKVKKPVATRKRGVRRTDYSSERPSGREAPGTGQPGDEVAAPADQEPARDVVEDAGAASAGPPGRPVRVPAGEGRRPAGNARGAVEAEEQIDHAGLEDEADLDRERAVPPPSPTAGGEVETRPHKWGGRQP